MPNDKLQIRINISIEKSPYFNERLTVKQEFTVKNQDFIGVCKILGQIDELAEKVKKEYGAEKSL